MPEGPEMAKVPRRLAAILAADIAGYSALMGADEAGTVRDLKAHQGVILPIITEHGGRIIDTAGDGILAEFGSVVNAAECAVLIQRTMAQRNADVEEARRMRFRIGINQGDVVFDDSRVYGDGVNVAARLENLAEPGGICVTRRVYEDICGKMQLAFVDLGEQQLKNIAQPVRVYRISGEQLAAGRVAAKPALFAASNIPIRVPMHFMGRDDALAAIAAAQPSRTPSATRSARMPASVCALIHQVARYSPRCRSA